SKPDGACLRDPASDRSQRTPLCRSASDDRIQRLFAREGAAAQRCTDDPCRPVRPEAAAMIAQLILSALLAATFLYAWMEYRRSPVVGSLRRIATSTRLD